MKISTKRGDNAHTDLLFARRVKKNCLRVETYAKVDELSSFLGLARSYSKGEHNDIILRIQKDLVKLMTELACANEDFDKLLERKYPIIEQADLEYLEALIEKFEGDGTIFNSWVQSGENHLQASLDIARSQCRRAERGVITLNDTEEVRPLVLKYLNRLSDFLYLLSLSEL